MSDERLSTRMMFWGFAVVPFDLGDIRDAAHEAVALENENAMLRERLNAGRAEDDEATRCIARAYNAARDRARAEFPSSDERREREEARRREMRTTGGQR